MTTTYNFKDHVDAEPTKQFFVDILTRDISLEDTVLDLLDNCHDGVLRMVGRNAPGDKPYKDYFARIMISEDWFSIEDNCGGIPPDVAEQKAFRMGREAADDRDKDLPTVGVYGIGMKRAIFKIGLAAEITSQYDDNHSFEVSIPETWVSDPKWKWTFPIRASGKILDTPGTRIMITPLHSAVSHEFSGASTFVRDLRGTIARYYARIIAKGFTVYVNDEEVKPLESTVLMAVSRGDGEIEPYAVTGEIGDVHLDLVCGFYRPVATQQELEDEAEVRRSRDEAGWTIICNDRVVLYKDRTRVTGWGLANVPNYHNQFISFTGVVELWSNNAKSLPLTTTKRGIDASSDVYFETLNYMMLGMKQFTSFTNKWKGNEEATRDKFARTKSVTAQQAVKRLKEASAFRKLHGKALQQATPKLPLPTDTNPNKRMSFSRPLSDIMVVSKFFFESPDEKPDKVGEQCFDYVLSRAKNG